MRLDLMLVENHLAASRQKAQQLISSGRVDVNGKPAAKPSFQVTENDFISVSEGVDFVSRGGHKLMAALEGFGLDINGLTAIDFGSSTGGFCDCMLRRGAAHVFAVDVGKGQMDPIISSDPRITLIEGVNARYFTVDLIGKRADFLTADLSFISLALVLPSFRNALNDGRKAVVLVKPQFEAGRESIGKHGVITDSRVHETVLKRAAEAARIVGFGVIGIMKSPIKGGDGNTEFLMLLGDPSKDADIDYRAVAGGKKGC